MQMPGRMYSRLICGFVQLVPNRRDVMSYRRCLKHQFILFSPLSVRLGCWRDIYRKQEVMKRRCRQRTCEISVALGERVEDKKRVVIKSYVEQTLGYGAAPLVNVG